MERSWDQAGTAKEKWNVMRDAMCSAARSELGLADRREADWFRESEDVLRPLFEKRNKLSTQWMCSGKSRDKSKLVEARRAVRRTVREVKNQWFQAKAAEASGGRNGGKMVWKCIRTFRGAGGGLFRCV